MICKYVSAGGKLAGVFICNTLFLTCEIRTGKGDGLTNMHPSMLSALHNLVTSSEYRMLYRKQASSVA